MPSSAPDVSTEIDVGERLRSIRRARRCTLRTVADRSGLSESFLSQVERGQSSASIASLRRIANALGVSIADLFEGGSMPGPRVLCRNERPALAFGVLGRKLLLTPRPLQSLEVFVGELEVGGEVFHLEHGDSIDYRSSTPHRASNAGNDLAEVMWIISPPSY